MKFPHGRRVVLLWPVSIGRSVMLPVGTPGVVERDTGAVVVVRFEDGRTIPVASEKLGNESAG